MKIIVDIWYQVGYFSGSGNKVGARERARGNKGFQVSRLKLTNLLFLGIIYYSTHPSNFNFGDSMGNVEPRQPKQLKDLKAGDKVVLIDRTGSIHFATIAKVGKVHIIVDGQKFRITTGQGLDGTVWNFDSIAVPTPELEAQVEADREKREIAKLVRRIKSADYMGVSLETLKAILSLLEVK
jgi:hypothetical protein